jgi:uncharacterized protein YfcZ (UPF0381/DUF406 family)
MQNRDCSGDERLSDGLCCCCGDVGFVIEATASTVLDWIVYVFLTLSGTVVTVLTVILIKKFRRGMS